MFNSIQIRLTLIFTLIILIAFGSLCSILIYTQHDSELKEVSYHLDKQAELVANLSARAILDGGDAPDLLAKKLGLQINAEVTIIATDGTVLGNSFQSPSTMENFSARPEVKDALATGTGRSIRYSIRYGTNQNYKNIYAATAIYNQNKMIGIARIALPLNEIEKTIFNQISFSIYAAIIIGVILVLVIWFVSRAISRPIKRLLETSNSISEGNLGQQVTVGSKDEVGRLGLAFNNMSQKLKEKDEKLANQLKEMESLSIHDSLTGLYNRHGFFVMAEQQLKLATRMQWNVLLLYIDLNDFKLINDNFGHKVGDQALVQTAVFLRDNTRKSDVIARLGGDEFVALMFNATEASPQLVVERLIANLKEFNANNCTDYQIKMSVGVAKYDINVHHSIDELISAADKTMYGKKKTIKASESYHPNNQQN